MRGQSDNGQIITIICVFNVVQPDYIIMIELFVGFVS